eukprot:gene23361-30273_t
MSFTGRPGTGKTSVAGKIALVLRNLGYLTKGHITNVTREDLVGQYVGHTAPKTREQLQKAEGGILFIDEAHHLYKPDNERDYGAEAIELLLQVMENQRDDLILIFGGKKEKLEGLDKNSESKGTGVYVYARRVREINQTTSVDEIIKQYEQKKNELDIEKAKEEKAKESSSSKGSTLIVNSRIFLLQEE